MPLFSATRTDTARLPMPVKRILLVEDCKSDVYLMERLLEEAHFDYFYDLTDVPRLADAFSRIEHDTYDLVMLDLNLLDIDGVASIAALRAHAPELPILVYSGMDDARLKEKALLCGATSYLVKGRKCGKELKHTIEEALRTRSPKRS